MKAFLSFAAVLASATMFLPPPAPAAAAAAARPATHAEVGFRLQAAERASAGAATLTTAGLSAGGRPLWLLHLSRDDGRTTANATAGGAGGAGETSASASATPAATGAGAARGARRAPRWRVLLYGQQHGDEVSGKDAITALAEHYAADGARALPPWLDLWLLPMVNPDGAEAYARRNARGADLNRDHQTLDQPETRALHELARRIRPDVAVDCHEYTRDTPEYLARGLRKRPVAMIDRCNHTALPPALLREADTLMRETIGRAEKAGIPAGRYELGGPPPESELRHSTLEMDDGRNGLAAHGCLSFIIEVGVNRAAADPQADLTDRVTAYRALLAGLVEPDAESRARAAKPLREARRTGPPPFLPTNQFWAAAAEFGVPDTTWQTGLSGTPTLDRATTEIATGNYRGTPVVKATVPRPTAYVIDLAGMGAEAGGDDASGTTGSACRARFAELLTRHGLPFDTLAAPATFTVEASRLIRIESDTDPLYNRFGGRQIVERDPPAPRVFAPGALVVRIDGADPGDALRAALLLEPNALYGLYQFAPWRAFARRADGTLPVWRVVEPRAGRATGATAARP